MALFCCYAFIFSIFHYTEFFFTAISNRRSLQSDSFLLNHSVAYWIAALASWMEFFLEVYLAPFLKVQTISMLGVAACICGEIIRKLAMLHAGNGFTHRLALSKRPDHRLVTTGIYAFLRHPGYTGWFMWSIGTQLILCNPLCLCGYAYVSWHFFNERIYDEERDLINFFGQQYINYRRSVWVGVPFVKGFEP
ncbi:isoprenylcysteine carboxyl methyltransferase family protein [Cooperia oncophora]